MKQTLLLLLGTLFGSGYGYVIGKYHNPYDGYPYWITFGIITVTVAAFTRRASYQFLFANLVSIPLMLGMLWLATLNGDVDPTDELFKYAVVLWPVYGIIFSFVSALLAFAVKFITNLLMRFVATLRA